MDGSPIAGMPGVHTGLLQCSGNAHKGKVYES